MRSSLLLFIFLFFVSCGGSSNGSQSKMSSSELTSSEVPNEAQTFDIQARLSGFTVDQETKIHKAFELIKKVIASDRFKKMVLEKKYANKKQFVDNLGLTNEQIYLKLLLASENLSRGNNNTMDLDLSTYFVSANVIGYTRPNIQTIFMNTKYLNLNSFNEAQVAMNITHEWLHKIGFGHAAERTPSREHSVPYAIGYIMRDLASGII